MLIFWLLFAVILAQGVYLCKTGAWFWVILTAYYAPMSIERNIYQRSEEDQRSIEEARTAFEAISALYLLKQSQFEDGVEEILFNAKHGEKKDSRGNMLSSPTNEFRW